MRDNSEVKPVRAAIDAQVVREMVGIAGAGLAGYGAWLHYQPAGFMVAGAILVTIAVIGTLKAGK